MEVIPVSKPFSLGWIAAASSAGEQSSVSTTPGAIRLTIGAPALWTPALMLGRVFLTPFIRVLTADPPTSMCGNVLLPSGSGKSRWGGTHKNGKGATCWAGGRSADF